MPLSIRSSGGINGIQMTTTGDGYTAPPTITFTGGGGTGAAATAFMNGTRVESIILTNAGTGYTGNPTLNISGNCNAKAYAYTGPVRPATFIRSRFGDVYAIDGMGRGLRWNGQDSVMEPIGIIRPGAAATVTALPAVGGQGKRISAIEMVDKGAGYIEEPVVRVAGGNPTKAAKLQAVVRGGVVDRVKVIEHGENYETPPEITFSGGNGTGAAFTVGLTGTVDSIKTLIGGQAYTAAPDVIFNNVWAADADGKTYPAKANAEVIDGSVVKINWEDYGAGATTHVTATLSGGGGGGAAIELNTLFGVRHVTVANSGSGYFATPILSMVPDPEDTEALAGAATVTITSQGNISGVTVTDQGNFYHEPSIELSMKDAVAVAKISKNLRGEYNCYHRYIDDTPLDQRGPIPSSISARAKVTIEDGAAGIRWDFTHPHIDDRVAKMELWRSSADQNVLLMRVATLTFGGSIQSEDGLNLETEQGDLCITEHTAPVSFVDTVHDDELVSQDRAEFGLMPITLPTGRTNARRFLPPPGNMGVAVVYQDRAWYTADQTGQQPNTLRFSEPDEPESVPGTNLLTLQESIGDTDYIVGLVPMGYMMLIAQSRHLYTMMYVSQPIIDANIQLACYRGLLNQRCADVMESTAFLADTNGIYTYDGTKEEPISVPIDNFWRESGEIDFTKQDQFFIKCDISDKTMRFFYCNSSDTEPKRAFCYCFATKAWWKEEFAEPVTCGTVTVIDGKVVEMLGGQTGKLNALTGFSDNGVAIPYTLKTGEMALTDEDGERDISVLYTPTEDESSLNLNLHFNASPTARANAIASNPGAGFVSSTTSTKLNMQKTRSTLGEANGMATARYAGRGSPKSAGGDKHLAIAVTGQQVTSTDKTILHVITIKGVE
jgi:hypothetical protein|tara:strand:- start:3043 stop:5715 length:2673 start_codon:yes stop_codon:yes gene_type:complete